MSHSNLDPETEAAIESALDSAGLRAGDATAVVAQPEPEEVSMDEGGDGE